MVGSSVTFSTPDQISIQQLMAQGKQIPKSMWSMGQNWDVYNAAHAGTPSAGGAMSGSYGSSSSGPGTIDNGPALGYGAKIMDMALDPQNALYGRTQQQLQEQTRAGLASRGINMSGAGAGIENQAMNNFNIDWQNNQLGRGVQGAGAYASLAGLAQNIANQGFQNYGSLGQSEFQAPAPSIPYAQPMPAAMGGNGSMGSGYPGGVDPFANYQQAPTGWSGAGGDFWAPGTQGYNPNFQWS